MIKQIVASLTLMMIGFEAIAFDPNLISNNKEINSLYLKRNKLRMAQEWLGARNPIDLVQLSKLVLDKSINEFKLRQSSCDLGIRDLIVENSLNLNLLHDASEFKTMLVFMRENDLIDDIFYKILLNSDELQEKLTSSRARQKRASAKDLREVGDANLNNIFSDFKSWPDEISQCSLGRYGKLMSQIGGVRGEYFYNKMKRWSRVALAQNVITADTYSKLQILTDNKVLDWDHYVRGYFEVVANAKDKLAQKNNNNSNSRDENEEYVSRRHKLTQRGRLYKTYDSTQIMLLSGIIQKAARRIDASQVSINFEFSAADPDDVEIYVLSPMERYRLAINMLKKDMAEMMRSQLFSGITIEYEDLVTAAFETGLIQKEELDHILKFEDMWNPQVPRWKKYAGFAFSLVGTASFYLPPPWNIIGAIGLVVTQTKVMNKDSKPSADDNWNSVI